MNSRDIYRIVNIENVCPKCGKAGLSCGVELNNDSVQTCGHCGTSFILHHDTQTAEIFPNEGNIIC